MGRLGSGLWGYFPPMAPLRDDDLEPEVAKDPDELEGAVDQTGLSIQAVISEPRFERLGDEGAMSPLQPGPLPLIDPSSRLIVMHMSSSSGSRAIQSGRRRIRR